MSSHAPRAKPFYPPGCRRLCRSCGCAFVPSAGTDHDGVSIACEKAECQLWAERYREALRFEDVLPVEYGMDGPKPRAAAVDREKAKRVHRRLRQLESLAIGNELRQAQREQAAEERGVETVSL